MSDLEQMCMCGHTRATHYNARRSSRMAHRKDYGAPTQPCHHLGPRDMRCRCRNFTPAPVVAS